MVNSARIDPFMAYFLNEFDGFIAFPYIRGEGLNAAWYSAGRDENKQNTFDDCKSAAKYLVDLGYTGYKEIVLHGASNGGLVVTTCINQSPELFGVAISQCGIMDMIRIFNGEGRQYTQEFGDPKNPKVFNYISKYSPYHKICKPESSEKQYPSTLIFTTDNDRRALPCHSLKYAAQLQHVLNDCEFQTNPTLLLVYRGSGHGHGVSILQRIKEATDQFTFIHQTLNAENLTTMRSKISIKRSFKTKK